MSEEIGVHLQIAELKKSFGEREVLREMNLNIQAGEFIAVIGKSGCGKSTLLRHIAGLEKQTAGEIQQDGKQIKGMNTFARIMFQDARLLPWVSVLENVGVGTGLASGWKKAAKTALTQVGLEERSHEWPSVLSGGQRQRIALARALAANPRLMLLDEPLGALDALTRYEMQELIERLWQEQQFTAILVTHDVSEALRLADRVVLIEDGEVTLDLSVNIPRPRKRSNQKLVELEDRLLQHLTGEQDHQEVEYEPEKTADVG